VEWLFTAASKVSKIPALLEQLAAAKGIVWHWGQLPGSHTAKDWKGWMCILAHPRLGASAEVFDSGTGESAEEALEKALSNYLAGASEQRRFMCKKAAAQVKPVSRPLALIAADLGIDLDALFS
jgi:hypothetical protein